MSHALLRTLPVLLALAACASPNAQRAELAQSVLVGMPKEELLSCAGVPERAAQSGELEFLTYTATAVSPGDGGARIGIGAGTDGAGISYSLGLPVTVSTGGAHCEATFTVRNGIVERLVYGGSASAGASRLGQCYTIVQNCLGPG